MLTAAAVALAFVGVRTAPEVRGGANLLVTGKGPEAIIDENNSPATAVNPIDSNNVVTVNRVDRPRYSAILHWSADGGGTWSDTALALPPGRDRPYAPDAAFAADGTLYVSYVNLEGVGNDPQTLWLSRSTDGGRSLSAPVQVAGRYSFQARVVAGPGRQVHITWVRAASVGLLALNQPAPVVMATSNDGGATFGAPVQVSDGSRTRVGAATPIVDSSGAVEVLYEDFKGDARDFDNLDGPPWDRPFALVLSRSTDNGTTFSPGVEVDSGLVPSERFLVYLPRFPSIAAGPDLALYVAWADARSGADQVNVRRSGDGGVSWGPRTPVTDGTTPESSSWLPKVSVAPNGRVDIVYLAGHRNHSDGLVGAHLASSADEATTFRTTPVSSTSFDSRIGPLAGPPYLPPDLGAQLGLASSDSGAVASWVDTRLGTAGNGRQDIFSAAVSISGTGLSTTRWAAIIVLLALAAVQALLAVVAGAGPRGRRMRG
ncbi:MAG: glycoside hydrolase [Candidatus Dormibacteraeota bacterium]|nr:glycoside hydrolase [Candidatus Dormibacteraeota bacterium]